MHIFRRNWDPGNHGFIRHPEIAVRMIWRHVSLITEEEVDFPPRDLRRLLSSAFRQQGIQTLRRVASGKGYCESTAGGHGGFGQPDKFISGTGGNRLDVVKYADLRILCHNLRLRPFEILRHWHLTSGAGTVP